MNEMGKRIAQKRKEKGYTMDELAKAVGVQASAINKYEKGLVENIKRSTIKQMALVLECDPVWLMGFDEIKKPDAYEISNKEKELVELYRNADATTKEMINRMLLFTYIQEKEGGQNEDRKIEQ